MNTVLVICGLILLISCLCSLLVSSSWMYESYIIDNARMCDPYVKGISIALCPFNQDMIAYKYNLENSDNYNKDYNNIFQDNYNKGRIGISDYFNDYFQGITAPPNNIQNVYCNKDFTLCNNDIKLTESIIYKGIYNGKIFFYIDLNLLINISGNTYSNLNDFIVDCNKYANPHPEFLQYYTLQAQIDAEKKDPNASNLDLQEKQTLFNQLELKCTGFTNYSTLVTTLKQSLLGTLNDNLLQQYYNLLQSKMNSKQMTTFEFFMYYAVSSIINYTSYTILTVE